MNSENKNQNLPFLSKYAVNMNRAASLKNTLLIGRSDEVRCLMQILCRLDKNNPILIGDAGVGKAQPLTSFVKTFNGWKKHEDLNIGDELLSIDGSITKIVNIFPQGKKDTYKIIFEDNRSTECCAEHLWKITQNDDSNWEIANLSSIMKKLEKNIKVYIPLIEKINYQPTDFEIDPFFLGLILGNCQFLTSSSMSLLSSKNVLLTRLSKIEGLKIENIVNQKGKTISNCELSDCGDFLDELTNLNVLNSSNKSVGIPNMYKFSSFEQKVQLIRGIIFYGFNVVENSLISTTSNYKLVRDVYDIVLSLGGICTIKEKKVHFGSIFYYTIIQEDIFRSLVKADANIVFAKKLMVKKIIKSGNKECQCIQVDNSDSLYITDNYIVTHNTVIVEGLAKMILNREVPENLLNYEIYSLNLNSLASGAKYRGELEERIEGVINDAILNRDKVILFIDEIHMLSQKIGDCDIGNIMKPALSRGELKCIGATTIDEYSKHIEPDKALKRRFNTIFVDEPTTNETITIIRGIKRRFENYYGIKISDKAISTAVELSKKHFVDLKCPDVAIDIIDETSSRMNFEFSMEPKEIANLSKSINSLKLEAESRKIDCNEEELSSINSDIEDLLFKYKKEKDIWIKEKEIIIKITSLKSNLENMANTAASLMKQADFTSAGQILYVEIPKLEKELNLLEQSSFIYVNTLMDKIHIVKTISSKLDIPVSKLLHDYRSTSQLKEYLSENIASQEDAIEAICDQFKFIFSGFKQNNRPLAVLFFAGSTGVGKTQLAKCISDFIFGKEKNKIIHLNMSKYTESHTVSNLLGSPAGYVGYGEEGELTGPIRKRPYRVVLFDEIEKAHSSIFDVLLPIMDEGHINDRAGRLANFKETVIIFTSNIGAKFSDSNDKTSENFKTNVREEIEKYFKKEFINRLDEIIVFDKINKSSFVEVAKIHLHESISSFYKEQGIVVNFSDKVLNYIANKSYNEEYGARDIKRNIQKLFFIPILKYLIENSIEEKISSVNLNIINDELIIN